MTQRRLLDVSLRFLAVVILAGCLATPAFAEVTSVGNVLLNEPDTDDITVGYANDSTTFAFGQYFVDGGSGVVFEQMVIGNQELAIGEVFISGAGTSVELDQSGTANPALLVGEQGTGTLAVSGGALLNVSSTAGGSIEIGEETTGFGRVTIDGRSPTGFPTRLFAGENTIVGGAGVGELTVSGGALVTHTDITSATLTIGEVATGHGVVTVDGAATFWQAPELVNIGVVGSGELWVRNGATFDANNGLLEVAQTTTVGPRGYVALQDGRFFVERATINGRLGGDGIVSGPITVSTTGTLSAGPGQKLQFLGDVANAGLVDIHGIPEERAEIEFLGALTNATAAPPTLDGRIAVADGVLRLSQALTNDGTLASTGGDTDFHGEITNSATGLIAIGGESHATFYDNVDVTLGTLSIATGSTALFLGDITISPGSNVSISVNQSATEEGFDTPLQVLGTTTLGGPITLELKDGFVPSEGDTIPLLEASGGFTLDTLSTQDFDPLPDGLAWEVLPTNDGLIAQVIANVVPGLEGDFDGDGLVSASDYTAQRDLQAPGGGGSGDLDLWKQNYGASLGGQPVVAASAPEPTAAALSLLSLLATVAYRRR